MEQMIWIAVAGAAGTLARWSLNSAFATQLGSFPWSTFLANCTGSLLFGIVWIVAERSWPAGAKAAVLVGFMGAFTTFSTFAFEVGVLLEQRLWLRAAWHTAAQNLAGIGCLLAGLWLGRTWQGAA